MRSGTQKTFYHRKNPDKAYHIDYIFASNDKISKTQIFDIGKFENWKTLSDHVPITWEFND